MNALDVSWAELSAPWWPCIERAWQQGGSVSVGAVVIDGRGTEVSAERNRASEVTAGVSYSR